MRRIHLTSAVAVALASGTSVYAQSSVVLHSNTGAYVIPATAPWTTLKNVRIEFRLHDITMPTTPTTLFSAGKITMSLPGDGNMRIYNAEDMGDGGNSLYLSMAGRSDATVRIQRDVVNKQVTIEVWDTNGGGNYNKLVQSYSTIGTGSWAQERPFGSTGALARVAYLHMSQTLVDVGSPPPSEHTNGDLVEWNFEGNLADSKGGISISMSSTQFAATPVHPPIALPIVAGAPAWTPEPTVRAGHTVQLLGSASYSFGATPALTYLWQQVSGPINAIWSDRKVANPKIEGLVFGEYRMRLTVTDASGRKGSKELVFGAVASDDNGVVATGDPKIDFVFGPLIRFGASPWTWHDQNHRDLAETYGTLAKNAAGVWAADWVAPLAGTVVSVTENRTITGQGTSFQTDFCGGAGNTAPVGNYPVIALRNGVQRYAALVSSCISQTEIRIAPGEEVNLPNWTNVSYSKTLNGAWWGGAAGGSGGQNNANYYDNVMAHYALYYRTGLKKYLEHARTLADRWYDSPFFLRAGSPPRLWSLAGIMWRAYEGNRANWWTDKLHPHLDSLSSGIASGAIGDAREEAYQVAFVAIGSKLTGDTTRAATYRQSLITAASSVWAPQRTAAGVWVTNANFWASWNGYPGTATVTTGSKIVTGSGTTWDSSWPWAGGNCFWIANNSLSGDPVTYRATWNSATQLTLDRPYEGPPATGKKWQLSNLCGPGTQPFMMGIVAAAWSYAYDVTGNETAKDLLTKAAQWIVTEGMQSSTKGLYYGRLFPNCEPINDLRPNCSYDPLSSGAIEASRFLSGEVMGGLAMAYLANRDATLLSKTDRLFGANFGKLGGPESDGIHATLLQASTNGSAPKNFGFFHGFGRAAAWPAARAGGLAPAKMKSLDIAAGLSDIPGATHLRVKTIAPTNLVSEKTCGAPPCRVAVNVSQGDQVVVMLEYLNGSGKVLSAGEPFVLH